TKFPHPIPLPEGEGIGGLISPASPIEKWADMLEKKVRTYRMSLISFIVLFPGLSPWAITHAAPLALINGTANR
ncbi:MAG TPA: hypothetical protein PK360_19975, partial [bacterium]|nr:hypothetical protein [bacterium]